MWLSLGPLDRPTVIKNRAVARPDPYFLSSRIKPIDNSVVRWHCWKAHEQYFLARSQCDIDDRRGPKLHRLTFLVPAAFCEQVDWRLHRPAPVANLNRADERGSDPVIGERQVDKVLAVGGVVSGTISNEWPSRCLLHAFRSPCLYISPIRDHERNEQRWHADDEMARHGKRQPSRDPPQSGGLK